MQHVLMYIDNTKYMHLFENLSSNSLYDSLKTGDFVFDQTVHTMDFLHEIHLCNVEIKYYSYKTPAFKDYLPY